jgi:hypothetical protein
MLTKQVMDDTYKNVVVSSEDEEDEVDSIDEHNEKVFNEHEKEMKKSKPAKKVYQRDVKQP